VRAIQAKGKTVVLTTHYMEEAYLLCDELLLMDRGVIIAEGSPQSLLKTHFDGVTIELPVADFAPMREKLDRALVNVEWTAHVKESSVEIPTKNVTAVLSELGGSGVTLERMRIRERTLDDLFLALTGKDLRT
jgi:ABC-2 type transport system ATP-binding protein